MNINGEEVEIPEDILAQLTLDNIHFMYATHNFADIIINNTETLGCTVDQFDDMYAGFFGVYSANHITGKLEFVDELSPMSKVETNEELIRRLNSFKFTLGSVALKLLPIERFQTEVLKDRNLLEFGLELCMTAMVVEPTLAEFGNFRQRLVERQFGKK